MSVLKLIRRMISPLLFLNIVSRYKGRSSLMKIKAAQLYVQGVQKARILFLGSLVGLVSLIFLASGLSLIHMALFSYSTWSVETKFVTAILLGGLEFAGAIYILFYLFREETWSKFYEINKVVDLVVKKNIKE